MSDQAFYTTKQLAPVLGLTLSAIRSATWRGRIRTVRIGRRVLIPHSEIERLLQAAR